jgi:methionyl aminopeptidase
MTAAAREKQVRVHTAAEIAGIRLAARATAQVLQQLCDELKPGMSTLDVDRRAEELIRQTGGSSAFYQYRGFPGQLCISLNDEVVHGIGRAERRIRLGDIVSLDVGVRLNGFIGDSAVTVCVGAPSAPRLGRLLDSGRRSLEAGIAAAVADARVNDIGVAVEQVVTGDGFSVVRDFVGHGCGCELHEPPEVANFRTADRGPRLQAGMVLAIEPMVNGGSSDVTIDSDGWTVRTRDGEISVHFEHMVLITDGEPEILTLWPKTP